MEAQLSARQRELLAYVRRYLLAHEGRAPTVREMAAGIGVSSSCTAHYHLKRLIAAGLMVRDPRIARGLSLSASGKRGMPHA